MATHDVVKDLVRTRWVKVIASRSQVHHRASLPAGQQLLSRCTRWGLRINLVGWALAWYVERLDKHVVLEGYSS